MEFNNDFRTDLMFSQEHERKIAEKLFNRPIDSIEVKVDRMAVDTGNIYIESSSRGKPSGLMTTESDIVIYHLEGAEINITLDTQLLRKTVIRLLPNPDYFKLGGDSNTSEGILINLKDLAKEINKTRRIDFLKNGGK